MACVDPRLKLCANSDSGRRLCNYELMPVAVIHRLQGPVLVIVPLFVLVVAFVPSFCQSVPNLRS